MRIRSPDRLLGKNNALFLLKEFSVIEVTDMVYKLGYSENVTMFYYFKKPSCDLDNGLHTLRNDYDVLALSDFEPLFGLDDIASLVNVGGTFKGKVKGIEVDVSDKGKGIALDDEVETLDDAKDAELSSKEEESDGFVDEENPEFNANEDFEVDMDVMDPDEYESASDEDELERIRKRKLK
nr:hypothetical protein [Tanacetum cinerariifolium]